MNNKKVLFVATVTGHIIAFHIPYLKMLKENGYEVHVASNGNEKIENCDKHFNLPFERFPFKLNNIKAYKELKKIINENNYEFIHCHTPVGAVLTRLAAKKVRKQGTKVIYTAHGFHFFKGAPIINWLIYYPIEKILSKYTDVLITINKEDYERAKKHFKAKQIELIHGVGVDKTKFNINMSKDDIISLRKEFDFDENDFIFISVGELNKNKNQIMQIEAMKEVVKNNDRCKLLIVGKGSLDSYLREKVKEYNLENYVKFAGFRKDIPQLLKSSNCLLATSYREGLPVNVMEAMMCGLPIIATNCRGQRDLVDENNIVEINDLNMLINKMKEFTNISKQNIDYDISEFELNIIKEKMRKIYGI